MTPPTARILRPLFLALLALTVLFGGHAAQAAAAPINLPLLKPKPAPAVAPVAELISADPPASRRAGR